MEGSTCRLCGYMPTGAFVCDECYQTEVERVEFLESLLEALHGERWNQLSLAEARRLSQQLAQSAAEEGLAQQHMNQEITS